MTSPTSNADPLDKADDRFLTPHVPRGGVMFLYSGLLFLFVAIGLFVTGGLSIYKVSQQGPIIGWPRVDVSAELSSQPSATVKSSGALTDRDRYDFYGQILSFFLGPLLLFLSGCVCAWVGFRLLKSAGVVERHVLPPQDYQLLSTAITDGNEKAISEYIRLSSLAGTTGTFTKIGLTGLPLATVFLTLILGAVGIFVPKFLDLAQLTLGAFIGSYVQRKEGEHQQVIGTSHTT